MMVILAGSALFLGGPAAADPPPPPPRDFLFSNGFSSSPGGTWSYLQANGSTYTPMTWDPAWNGWRGNCTYCVITRDFIHPGDSTDSVIAWTAPRAGNVAIRGMIDHTVFGPNSDGVRAVIKQRRGATVTQIWPSTGYQEVPPYFTAQHILKAAVQAGDLIYFQLNRNVTAADDTSRWDPRVSYDYEPEYTLDRAELVMRPADFSQAGISLALDASLSVVPNGTNIDFYHSGGDTIQKFRGTLQQPGQTAVPGSHFTNPQGFDGKWWIANIYRAPGGQLLAFCHIEDQNPNGPSGWWAGGLAYSTDGGTTFEKLGKTLSTRLKDSTSPFDDNIQGMPFVIKDGYFLVYYSDTGGPVLGQPAVPNGPTVARARVDDVLAAAANHTVTPWMKYYNGGWTEPGIAVGAAPSGLATPVIAGDPTDYYMTHGDAAYSTYLGQYLLSSYSHGPGKGTYLAFSEGGTSFSTPSWLQKTELIGKNVLSPYETIVNLDGSDNAVVGQSFYLYSGYRPWADGVPEAQWPQQFRWLYRQKVTLNRAGFGKNETDAATDFSFKQGANNWIYQEFDSATNTYSNMAWDFTQRRWQGSATNLMSNDLTQHPDAGRDSVRAWVAPRNATVRITAGMAGISVGTGTNADGVRVKITRQGQNFWPATGYQLVAPATTYAFQPVDVPVTKGDVLRFHVNQNTTNAFDTTLWEPIISFLGDDRITYLADAGFTGTQGTNQWWYKESSATGYPLMTWNAGQSNWQGSAANLLITDVVAHPVVGKDSVRAWKAPKTGTINIGVTHVDGIWVATGTGADGIRVKIMKDSVNVWPASGYQPVGAGAHEPFAAIVLPVTQGETLYFHVNANLNNGFDSTVWVPAISYR